MRERLGRFPGIGRARTPYAAHLLSLLAAACGGDGSGSASVWESVRDTVGDTIVVRTLSGSVWGDARLVEEARIGRLEGPPEYTLGDVNGIAVGLDGTIYAMDRQGPALRAYSLDGTYLRRIGREGEGPGEYKQPDSGLAVLPDGRILLRDPGNARITVYSPEGEFLEDWRIRGGFFTSTPLFVDSLGNAYQYVWTFGEDESRGLVRYGPDGEPGDTLHLPAIDYEPPILEAVFEQGDNRSVSRTTVPFSPQFAWSFGPGGRYVTGLSSRYAIEVPRDDGTVLRIERAVEPVPVLPEEKANQRERTTWNMRRTDPGWSWNGPAIPDVKPAFRSLFVDEDGRIWVQVHAAAEPVPEEEIVEPEPGADERPPERWREPVRFDVFEPDGTYLGRLEAPKGFSTYPRPVARGEHLWARVVDELDVPYIVRFRIEPEERP